MPVQVLISPAANFRRGAHYEPAGKAIRVGRIKLLGYSKPYGRELLQGLREKKSKTRKRLAFIIRSLRREFKVTTMARL